jgi:hypothetical protein
LTAETDLGDTFHIESHSVLLQQSADAIVPNRALDAIIVPTIRPQSLRTAAMLADNIGCSLVVLCSTRERAGQAHPVCRPLGNDAWVPQSLKDNWLSFLTSVHPENKIEDSCHADMLVRQGPVVGGALMSLAAARKQLTGISPLACAPFIPAWRTDVVTWRHTLLGLPVLGDLADAVKFVGLPAQMGCEQ